MRNPCKTEDQHGGAIDTEEGRCRVITDIQLADCMVTVGK